MLLEPYIILRCAGTEELERAVNDAIRNGYEPVGGPFIAPYARGYRATVQIPTTMEALSGGWVEYDFCQAIRRRKERVS